MKATGTIYITSLLLSLTACSFSLSEGPSPAAWNIDLDESIGDTSLPAFFTVPTESGSRTLHAQAEVKVSSGETDAIDLNLVDEYGVDIEEMLAGMPADNRWTLFRLNDEREYIAARLAAWLWSALGRWSPRIERIELSRNGYDPGLWLLSETLSRGDSRIPIKKLDTEDDNSWTIQGGYIYRLRSLEPLGMEGNEFLTLAGFVGKTTNPDFPTRMQLYYLASYHNGYEAACFRAPASIINAAISDYVDIDAFVDWVIVQELAMLVPMLDTEFRLYKERGEKLRPCPIPDYRNAFIHSANDALVTSSVPSLAGMHRDPEFSASLHSRWEDIRAGLMSNEAVLQAVRDIAMESYGPDLDETIMMSVSELEYALKQRLRQLDRLF